MNIYYKLINMCNIFAQINAERAPEEIFAEVEKSIDELLAKKGKKA